MSTHTLDPDKIIEKAREQHELELQGYQRLSGTQQKRFNADAEDAEAWAYMLSIGKSTRQLEALGFVKPGGKAPSEKTGKRRGRRKATDSLAAVG